MPSGSSSAFTALPDDCTTDARHAQALLLLCCHGALRQSCTNQFETKNTATAYTPDVTEECLHRVVTPFLLYHTFAWNTQQTPSSTGKESRSSSHHSPAINSSAAKKACAPAHAHAHTQPQHVLRMHKPGCFNPHATHSSAAGFAALPTATAAASTPQQPLPPQDPAAAQSSLIP